MRRARVLAVCAVLLAACSDDGGSPVDARPPIDAVVHPAIDGPLTHPELPETLPSPLPSGPVRLVVPTFNNGLVQLVKAAPQPIAPFQAALAALDADVICLQELYTQ